MATTTNSLIVSNNAKIDGKLVVNRIASSETEMAAITPYIDLSAMITISGAGGGKILCGYDGNYHTKLTNRSSYLDLYRSSDGSTESATLSAPDITLTAIKIVNISTDSATLSAPDITLAATKIVNIGKKLTDGTSTQDLVSTINLFSNSTKIYGYNDTGSTLNSITISPSSYSLTLSGSKNVTLTLPTVTCTLIGTNGTSTTTMVRGDGVWFTPITVNGINFTSKTGGIYAPITKASYTTADKASFAIPIMYNTSTAPTWKLIKSEYNCWSGTASVNSSSSTGNISAGSTYQINVSIKAMKSITFFLIDSDGDIMVKTLSSGAINSLIANSYSSSSNRFCMCTANAQSWFSLSVKSNSTYYLNITVSEKASGHKRMYYTYTTDTLS